MSVVVSSYVFRLMAVGKQMPTWDAKDVIMLYSQKMKRRVMSAKNKNKEKHHHQQPPPCLHLTLDLTHGISMTTLRQSGVICVYVYGANVKELEMEKDEEFSLQELHAASPIFLNLTPQTPFAYFIHRCELDQFRNMIRGFRNKIQSQEKKIK